MQCWFEIFIVLHLMFDLIALGIHEQLLHEYYKLPWELFILRHNAVSGILITNKSNTMRLFYFRLTQCLIGMTRIKMGSCRSMNSGRWCAIKRSERIYQHTFSLANPKSSVQVQAGLPGLKKNDKFLLTPLPLQHPTCREKSPRWKIQTYYEF